MSKRKISSYFTPDDATEKSKKSCGMEMRKWRKSYNVPSIKTVKKWEKELAVQLTIESADGEHVTKFEQRKHLHLFYSFCVQK